MDTIVYLVFAFFIILFAWIFYQRQTFKSYVTGAILCTFITASGASYDKVLPVEGKWVLPPKGKWLKKKDTRQRWGKYILPEDTYTTSYPLAGWPEFMRVEVRRAFYYEDCPAPIVPEIIKDGKQIKIYPTVYVDGKPLKADQAKKLGFEPISIVTGDLEKYYD